MPAKKQRSRKHFSLVRQFHIADFLTLSNAASGFLSILFSLNFLKHQDPHSLLGAFIAIPTAFFLDVLDGRVARWRATSSILGQELDSLSDLISFGVAPAVLGFILGFETYMDCLALTYFVCCGVARLARYNATVSSLPKDSNGKIHYFEGTPIPTTLAIVSILAYCYYSEYPITNYVFELPYEQKLHSFALMYMVSGTAMISKTLRIPKP